MSWIIYKHTNKINGKVYIGQTRQHINDRWKNGLGYFRYKDRSLTVFEKAIRKYGWNNFIHEIIEDNLISQEMADQRESYWINYYRSYIGFDDCNGYNMTLGGETGERLGLPVIQIDKKTWQKVQRYATIAEASRSFDGTIKYASMIRRACLGSKNSAKGYYWCYEKDYSDDWIPSMNIQMRRVFQLDDQYDLIRCFDSIAAAERTLKISGIGNCCRRKQAKAGLYYWCFEEDYSLSWKPPVLSFLRNEKIYCIETGKVYDNATQAALETKSNKIHLLHCCNKREGFNSVNNLHFCYLKDKDSFEISEDKDESKVMCINTGKEYKSIVLASKETGASASSISDCCRGIKKTSNGLSWCYKKDYNDEMVPNKSWKKRIVCIETNDIYESVLEASKKTNISRSCINNVLYGKRKTAGGYHWKYFE